MQGFRKNDPEQWEFANEVFIRGQRHLLKNIQRRKPVHSHSGQGNTVPLTDSEREDFEKEIDKLRQEKVFLQSEVERRKHENQGYEYKIRSLGQTLQNIDHRQQQLMVTFAQLLDKPGYTHSEPQNKKRRMLALHFLNDEGNLDEKGFLENSSTSSLPSLDLEKVEKLDSSLSFWEKFLHGVDQTLSGDFRDYRSQAVIREMAASSEDSDLNVLPCSPRCHMSASPSQDNHSSPEVTVSSTYADSPAISSICIDLDSRLKPLGIDVNISPTKVSDTEMAKDRQEDGGVPAAGMNDGFWQQFFTEAPPSSSVAQEVQSEILD